MHKSLKNTRNPFVPAIRDKSSWHTCLKRLLLAIINFHSFNHLLLFKRCKSPHPQINVVCIKEVLEGLRPGSDPKLFKSRTMHLVWYMRRLVSESKPFQSWSKIEIPGWARWEEWPSHSKSKQALLIKLLVQTLNFSCTWFNVLVSTHEKIGEWTRPKMQHWF